MTTWIYEGVECFVAKELITGHVPVYRAWNGSDHFFTSSLSEYNGLSSRYNREGIAFYIANYPMSDHVHLFRLYNSNLDDHFYCTSVVERDDAKNNHGYVLEGIIGYVIPSSMPLISEGHVPLFRAYHAGFHDHFYTISAEEIQAAGSALVGGRSVGWLKVETFGYTTSGGSSCSGDWNNIPEDPATVPIPRVTFRIDISYSDHLAIDRGKGRFIVRLYVMRQSGLMLVEEKKVNLGTGDSAGNWSSFVDVSHVMENRVETYQLEMKCKTRDIAFLFFSETDFIRKSFNVVLGENIGNFTLRYIPLTIVYCPPGQDMTNSLSLTDKFATQLTIGNSRTIVASEEFSVGFAYKGIMSSQIGHQESQSGSNTATNGHKVSYFRNTVVTADNQRAIGRAYWGPLGDLFVIMVNARYAAWGSLAQIQYEHTDCDQILIIPAHKLLRPNDDPIAQSIPPEERRALLELDPFINKWALGYFFPQDQGRDLSIASNPYADPTPSGRVDTIGIWHLSTGTELNYSIGEEIELNTNRGQEILWTTGISGSAQVIIGMGGSSTTTVGIQQTMELKEASSKSASCFLTKNQNASDLDGIKIYYDKNFGTLMFRKIRMCSRPYVTPSTEYTEFVNVLEKYPDILFAKYIPALVLEIAKELGIHGLKYPTKDADITLNDFGIPKLFPTIPKNKLPKLLEQLKRMLIPDKSFSGKVYDATMQTVFNEDIELFKGNTPFYKTHTDENGRFRFDNILPGEYTLRVGDKLEKVNIEELNTFLNPKEVQIKNVKRVVDFKTCPRWKFRELTGISSKMLDDNLKQLVNLDTMDKFAKAIGLSDDQKFLLQKRVHLAWFKSPEKKKPQRKKK